MDKDIMIGMLDAFDNITKSQTGGNNQPTNESYENIIKMICIVFVVIIIVFAFCFKYALSQNKKTIYDELNKIISNKYENINYIPQRNVTIKKKPIIRKRLHHRHKHMCNCHNCIKHKQLMYNKQYLLKHY